MFLQLCRFDETPWMRLLAPLAAGAALAAACHGDAGAATPQSPREVYVLSDNDGYGLVDCIAQKRECAKIVADSWCEAHGHGPALAFGGAADVTGAIAAASEPAPVHGAAMVRCAE